MGIDITFSTWFSINIEVSPFIPANWHTPTPLLSEARHQKHFEAILVSFLAWPVAAKIHLCFKASAAWTRHTSDPRVFLIPVSGSVWKIVCWRWDFLVGNLTRPYIQTPPWGLESLDPPTHASKQRENLRLGMTIDGPTGRTCVAKLGLGPIWITGNIWMFPKIMVPQSIQFNRVFHY